MEVVQYFPGSLDFQLIVSMTVHYVWANWLSFFLIYPSVFIYKDRGNEFLWIRKYKQLLNLFFRLWYLILLFPEHLVQRLSAPYTYQNKFSTTAIFSVLSKEQKDILLLIFLIGYIKKLKNFRQLFKWLINILF